jgi:glutamate---cysteine ligase / carboxylate-amine ligase
VFGQHIHIGCPSGDDCLYLCHAFANYIPHFIALSASSPFNQGVDTAFDCSRLTVVSAFPLSGTPPWLMQWEKFEEYFHKLSNLGVVKSMKDFYWDIRPKPEFGTVEIRICDTPLSIKTAAALGAFAQVLATYLLENRQQLSKDIYLTYLVNRFRATRYGLDAIIIDPINNAKLSLADNILLICNKLMPYAAKLNCIEAIEYIVKLAKEKKNDAYHLRQFYNSFESLPDVVRKQTEIWMD